MDNNCIFCKIIGNEIPSATIYEDENFKVIMDISPAAKGHAIMIAKKHIPDIFELDIDTAKEAYVVASKVAKAMKDELHCDGINILQNNGEAAGQTVFHFHIHMVPRFINDSVIISWKPVKYGEGEAKALAEAIGKRIGQ